MCLNETCVPLPEGCPNNCSGKPMRDSKVPVDRPGVLYEKRYRSRLTKAPLSKYEFLLRAYKKAVVYFSLLLLTTFLAAGYNVFQFYFKKTKPFLRRGEQESTMKGPLEGQDSSLPFASRCVPIYAQILLIIHVSWFLYSLFIPPHIDILLCFANSLILGLILYTLPKNDQKILRIGLILYTLMLIPSLIRRIVICSGVFKDKDFQSVAIMVHFIGFCLDACFTFILFKCLQEIKNKNS